MRKWAVAAVAAVALREVLGVMVSSQRTEVEVVEAVFVVQAFLLKAKASTRARQPPETSHTVSCQ
jgi:hypothetical protein